MMLLPSNLARTAQENTLAQHDSLAYALAYVERCRGYVPLLEREQDRLLAALAETWRSEQYPQVVQLVTGLAYLAGRFSDTDQGQRILLQGIHACRETRDLYHLASFLNRLSCLLFAQGTYDRAREIWDESLSVAHAPGRTACLWEPLASFVYVIDLPCDFIAVQHFAHTLLNSSQDENLDTIAVALFVRGFGQHIAGNEEKACEEYTACLRLLAGYTGPSLYKHFFEIEVQAELARVQGDFARAREYTLAAVSLSESLCDPYMTATLLWDEVMFANRRGILGDAYPLAAHLVSLARYIRAPHFFKWCAFLIRQLPPTMQGDIALALSRHMPAGTIEGVLPLPTGFDTNAPARTLSQRELEVLRSVASGCSNQEIAAQLVITTGTVKKHLEHVYDKLDVYSRTQAVARARESGLL